MVNASQLTPLAALQERFAILDSAGEIRVADRYQIARLLAGTATGDLALYRKPDAELMMRRCLEAFPFSSIRG